MTPLLPPELTPSDLPLTELNALRLDGELFTLAGAWCPVDTCDGPEARAGAIARLAPPRAAAERLTAAWILGLVPEPARHQFCVEVGARTTHQPEDPRLQLREVVLGPAETRLIGRLRVTTARRTALDLARWGGAANAPVPTALLADLLERAGFDGTGRAATPRGISFSRQAAAQLQEAARLVAARQEAAGQVAVPALAVADPVDVVHGVDSAHGVQHPVQVGGVPHLEDEPADRQSVA